MHHDFADGGKIRGLVRDGATLVLCGLEQSTLSPHDTVALARTATVAGVTSHTSPG